MKGKLKAFLITVAILAMLALALYLPAVRPLKLAGLTEGPAHAETPEATTPASPGGLKVPEELAGLRLAGPALTGDAAVAEISELHGASISVVDGFIAMYGNGSLTAMLWVSRSASADEAGRLLALMDAKMPASAAFTNRTEKTIGGTPVYFVQGQGMDNYYWQQGDLVVWLGLKNVAAADGERHVLAARKALGR